MHFIDIYRLSSVRKKNSNSTKQNHSILKAFFQVEKASLLSGLKSEEVPVLEFRVASALFVSSGEKKFQKHLFQPDNLK